MATNALEWLCLTGAMKPSVGSDILYDSSRCLDKCRCTSTENSVVRLFEPSSSLAEQRPFGHIPETRSALPAGICPKAHPRFSPPCSWLGVNLSSPLLSECHTTYLLTFHTVDTTTSGTHPSFV